MKFRINILCLLIFCTLYFQTIIKNSSYAATNQAIGNIWIHNPSNSHYYKKLTGYSTWHAYETQAVNEGAHLVTINDANEQNWLISTFGGTDSFWIGYTDEITQTVWLWTSGEPTIYTNWYPGEPSNSSDGINTEHYALMNWVSPGLWNDGWYGAVTAGGIIEKNENPYIFDYYIPIIVAYSD